MVDINKLKSGDILSESSHYITERIIGSNVHLKHYEGGKHICIDKDYVEAFLNSADEIIKTVEVTKEDKKDGTPGIRSIFESIKSYQVFTVCFQKQSKARSTKAVATDIEERTKAFTEAIEKAKSQKKSISDVAKKYFTDLIVNPILDYEEGENRVLRGYKIQFESRDGRFACIDMDIEKTDEESGIRTVNINSIKWLIYKGIRYIVK